MNLSLIGTIYLWILTKTWSGSVRNLILNMEDETLTRKLSLGNSRISLMLSFAKMDFLERNLNIRRDLFCFRRFSYCVLSWI